MSLSKYNKTTKELEPIAGGFDVQGILDDIGDLTDLDTTDKSSLVDAINEVNSGKVDKVTGKGLSTNDYSDTEKGKVADSAEAIEAMSNKVSTTNAESGDVALVCSKVGHIIIVGLQGTFTDGYPQWGYFSIPYEISRIFYQVSSPFVVDGGHDIKAKVAINPGETVAWYCIGYVE